MSNSDVQLIWEPSGSFPYCLLCKRRHTINKHTIKEIDWTEDKNGYTVFIENEPKNKE